VPRRAAGPNEIPGRLASRQVVVEHLNLSRSRAAVSSRAGIQKRPNGARRE
jgi:hypothetical protein